MSLSPELLSAAVASAKRSESPKGVSCYFVKLNQYWGVKVYSSEEERDYAASEQLKAFNYGYAPAVGCSFEVAGRYCYATEVAEQLVDARPESVSGLTWAEKERACQQHWIGISEQIELLESQLQLHKLCTGDCHYGNYGYLRGFLVRIDFGY